MMTGIFEHMLAGPFFNFLFLLDVQVYRGWFRLRVYCHMNSPEGGQ